jgi:hypothetical protein
MWRNKFQEEVNALAEGIYLQYTLSAWVDRTHRIVPGFQRDPKVSVITDSTFPYLDMLELFWDTNYALAFQLHLKSNQRLQYLNTDSVHTKACFKAIPLGVSTRLTNLTTFTPSDSNKSMSMLYPHRWEN